MSRYPTEAYLEVLVSRSKQQRDFLSISTIEEVRRLEQKVRVSAARATAKLSDILDRSTGLASLSSLKFEPCGCDPFDETRDLNLIEQINQSFTYLVSLRGVEYLLVHHPLAAPFVLNIGARTGTDIISHDKSVAAETFAAVTPNNNKKLQKDIERVKKVTAVHRYVFHACAKPGTPRSDPQVTIIGFTLSDLLDESTASVG